MIRLIDNLSQILTAASINVSNSIENWFPYIDEAQETFIKPVLGNALFDQLQGIMAIVKKELQFEASLYTLLQIFSVSVFENLIIGEPQPKEQMPLLGQLRGL